MVPFKGLYRVHYQVRNVRGACEAANEMHARDTDAKYKRAVILGRQHSEPLAVKN